MHEPLALLAADRARARELRDPWASLCVLSTHDAGTPQARVLVLRDISQRLAVFINATSPKQAQLGASSEVAVLTYLASVGVQYRMMAGVERIPDVVVQSSWRERPRIPKVMDHLYARHARQSTVVASPADLQSLFDDVAAGLSDDPDAPVEAIGYFLAPREIERLELAADRLHRRERFTVRGKQWRLETLVP